MPWPAPATRMQAASSLLTPAAGRWLGRSGIPEDLYSMVVRIRDVYAVAPVNGQSGGQLELLRSVAALAEVKQQFPLAVESLDGIEHPVHNVQVPITVSPYALGTEHAAVDLANAADLVQDLTRRIQGLHPEIHGIDHQQFPAHQPQFGWEIELAGGHAAFPDRLHNIPLQVENKHLVARSEERRVG